jgi:hypothetical protein
MATKKIKSRRNKTQKTKTVVSNAQKSSLVKTFFEILHTIKLYHWKTKSYSQHKGTDELHEKLAQQTDRFVEVLLGKTSSRIDMVEHKITLYDFDNKQDFKHKLFEFRQFLIDLREVFPTKRDADLMTIKDEMLESVNQFLYILTLT